MARTTRKPTLPLYGEYAKSTGASNDLIYKTLLRMQTIYFGINSPLNDIYSAGYHFGGFINWIGISRIIYDRYAFRRVAFDTTENAEIGESEFTTRLRFALFELGQHLYMEFGKWSKILATWENLTADQIAKQVNRSFKENPQDNFAVSMSADLDNSNTIGADFDMDKATNRKSIQKTIDKTINVSETSDVLARIASLFPNFSAPAIVRQAIESKPFSDLFLDVYEGDHLDLSEVL